MATSPPAAAAAPARFQRAWWAERIPVPTRRLAWLTVALSPLGLLAPAPWGFVAIPVGVLVLFAVDAVRAVAPGTIALRRRLPGVIQLGNDAELVWQLRNPTQRPVRVHLADELAPSLHASARRATVTLAGGARAEVTATLAPARRGRFELSRLVVRTEGPWGLAARQAARELPATLRIHPSFRSRDEAELRIERGRILEVGLRSAKGRGSGTEFDSLRDYSVDDEFRRIDWAATARAGRPIVRTFRAERNQTVLLLLDTGRVMAGLVEDAPRLDHAMDAVLAVTTVATRLGDRAALLTFGARVHGVVPASARASQIGVITDALYRLEPELAESAYRDAFTAALVRFRRRALLILITELADEAVTETLLPALPLVLRDHIVIVASVRDPAIERLERSVAQSPGEAYRIAAASAARVRRDRTAQLLRARGVVVVDAPPGALAGRLADAYLDIKAAGRL